MGRSGDSPYSEDECTGRGIIIGVEPGPNHGQLACHGNGGIGHNQLPQALKG